MATALQIQQLYIAYFGRPADPSGLDYWVSTNISTKDFAAAMYAQPEFLQANQSLPVSEQVNAIYLNLFGRNGDVAGLTYWTQQINTGKLTLASIANDLIFAANNSPASAADKAVLDSKTATAITYTADVRETTASFLAYNPTSATPWVTGPQFTSAVAFLATATAANIPSSAAVQASVDAMTAITPPGQTFTLTTSIDTATATTFNGLVDGTAPTFTTLDTLTGAGNSAAANILRLADSDAGPIDTIDITPVGATLSNIGNLQLALDAIGTLSTAGALFAGVSNVKVDNVGAVTSLTVGAAQALTATNTNQAANNVAYQGGTNVAITNTKVTTGTIIIGSTTAPKGTVTLNSSGVYADGADNTLGTIAVTGGSIVTINALNGVTATQRTAATTDTSNFTITQGAVTVTGKDTTTSVAVTQSATVGVSNGDATGKGKIGETAGAVTVNDVNASSATAAGIITTVSLNNAGAATVNSGALTTLNLAGKLTSVNAGTLGALTTAANSVLAVNLTSAVSTGELTIDTDIKTINITGSGTANTIHDLVNASATAVNISGSVGVTVTGIDLAGNAVITSTNTAGTTVTEQLQVDQQFVGGTGADGVSIAATTKAINLGDGNDVATISVVTFGIGGTLNGGSGTNTIVANTNTSNLQGNANITNFTTLRVAGTSAQGAHNATGFTGLEIGELAAAMSFTGVAAGTPLKYLASTGHASAYQLANATGTSDVLNITLSSKSSVAANTLTAADIETINIINTDTDTKGHANTLGLVATSATSINLSGNAGLTLTNTGNASVTSFNASGLTPLIYADGTQPGVVFTSANNNNIANVTITGSAGADILTGSAAKDLISGGAGTDVLRGLTGADNINGGAGADTIVQSTGDSVAATSVTLGNVPSSGFFAEGSTFVFGNGVDVITGSSPSAAVNNVRTATDTVRFVNQFTTANVNIKEFWTGGATAADIDRLLPGQLIANAGVVGFYNGSGGVVTTEQGFYVAGTWNSATSTFTVSATLTPGNDALVFTVAAGTGAGATYGRFDNGNVINAAAFFTDNSSAFILDAV